MRTQLNTLVFDKTLRRKDATIAPRAKTGPDTPAPPPAKPSKPQKPPRVGRKASTAPNQPRAGEAEPLIDAKGISATGQTPPNRAAVSRVAAPPPATAAQATESGDSSALSSRSAVLNLFSVDVDRISDFATWAYCAIDAPVELIIGTYFLYRLLGSAALIGVAVNIVFVPANHLASSAFARTQDRLMDARDRRIALVTEVLQSVRTVKAFAWEEPFESARARGNGADPSERCMEGRAKELQEQRNNYALEIAFDALWSLSPVISVVVAFLVYTKIQGHVLTPSIAFTSFGP